MRFAVLVLLGGCVENVPTPPMLDAHAQFVQTAWPALATCAGCHAAQPTIDFLAPGTADAAYTTLLAFQPGIVSIDQPDTSLLVNMGKHTGPALDQTAQAAIL